MRIVCTGSPKTGTHALYKMVSLFYEHLDTPVHDHIEYRRKEADKTYIHITRNPRNVLVSWLRFNAYPVDESHLLQEMKHIIEEMKLYSGWLKDKSILTVRFESLFAEEALQQIAQVVGREPVTDHLTKAWGGTRTWTGRHSIWQNAWTPTLEKHWKILGGTELEGFLNYAN